MNTSASLPRLVRAELGRLRSRRSFWVFALVALVLLAAFQIAVNHTVAPPDAAEQAQSRAIYEQALQQYQTESGQDQSVCLDNGGTAEDCAMVPPQLTDFVRTPEAYGDVTPTSLMIGMLLCWLVAYLIGGASSGGEFSTGSIGNWLTFVPRRGAVFASKLLAVVLSCAVFSAVLAAVALLVPALLVAVHHGSMAGHVAALIGTAGRGIALAVVLAALGFCLGLLFRHTVAAIGIAFGYLLVAFVRASVLRGVDWAQRITPWMPEANLLAIYQKRFSYELPPDPGTVSPDGEYVPIEKFVSLEHGLIYLAVLLVVVVVGTALVFRRRDVA